jgi:hypothetical protein
MPIDPSIASSGNAQIPMGLRPMESMGPDKMLSLADMAMKLRQGQQQEQARNALREVFSNPEAVDPATGMPTQASISKVMAIDPATGQQLQQNMMKQRQQQMQMELQKTELFGQKVGRLKQLESEQASAYQRALEGGATPEQAQAAAQRVRNQHIDAERKSGVWSPDELKGVNPTYNHDEVTARVENYTQFLDRRAKEKEAERRDSREERMAKTQEASLGIQQSQESRARRKDEEERGGLGIEGGAVDEAARQYMSTGNFPTGASRAEKRAITGRAADLRATGVVAGKELGSPSEVEVDAGDGAVRRVLAQQDKNTGKWVTADEKRDPITGVKRILTAGERAIDDNAALTTDEIKFMSRQYLSGDHSVMQNLGRGVQGSRNIVSLRKGIAEEAKAQGMSPEMVAIKSAEFMGLKAGERALGTRTANIEMAVVEADKLADLALTASEKFDRPQFTPLNRAIQMAEKGTGGTAIADFVAANTSFINVYARAINPTGATTVSDKEHARKMLDTADTKEQYRSVVAQLKKEMAAAREAPGEVRAEFRRGYGGERNPPTGGDTNAPTIDKPGPAAVRRFNTDAEVDKAMGEMKPGEEFIGPDGKKYRKR